MQIFIAILLLILAIVLFLSKRWLSNAALERAANAGGVVAAIGGLIVLAFYTFSPVPEDLQVTPSPPQPGASEAEYYGRVVDINTQSVIEAAKVTLDLQGIPRIDYTDSEGVYRFNLSIDSEVSGTIRVDAQGYQVYTRNISLSADNKTIEDIRLMPQSSGAAPEPAAPSPQPFDPTSEGKEQVSSIQAQSTFGTIHDLRGSICLWTDVTGRGATILLTLEETSTIDSLRVALDGNFVRKVRLAFSDGSEQIKDLKVTPDYDYQDVALEPVRTTQITVEVLEVQDNFVSNFGICHIEVFGTKLPAAESSTSGLTLVRTILPTNLVAYAALSSDGTMVALAEFDGTIRVLSTQEDRLIGSFRAGTGILSLAISPDNQRLAAGLTSTTVKVWRVNDGVELPILEGLTSGVFNVTFSQDGQVVATSAKPDLILWRVSDGSILQRFTGISAIFTNMAFSADGNLVASGFEALTVRVWQVNNGQVLHDLRNANARALAFSRNGELLATVGQGTNIDLWRMQDGASVPPALTGHTQMVESLAFSIDHQTLVTASRDIEVRRWQISDHQRLDTWKEDGTNVKSVLLSADGQTLIALYMDGAVKIWHVP